MLNRNEIALSLLPSLISTAGNDNTLVVGHAFEIADEYIEAVNMSKAESVDGWISVKDRLPEESVRVILFDADVGALSGRYLGKHRYLEGEKDKGACITHWQALPNNRTETQFTYATESICKRQGELARNASYQYKCNFQQVPVYVPKGG